MPKKFTDLSQLTKSILKKDEPQRPKPVPTHAPIPVRLPFGSQLLRRHGESLFLTMEEKQENFDKVKAHRDRFFG